MLAKIAEINEILARIEAKHRKIDKLLKEVKEEQKKALRKLIEVYAQ